MDGADVLEAMKMHRVEAGNPSPLVAAGQMVKLGEPVLVFSGAAGPDQAAGDHDLHAPRAVAAGPVTPAWAT